MGALLLCYNYDNGNKDGVLKMTAADDIKNDEIKADEPAAAAEPKSLKELEIDGFKFKVDTDLIDDVDAFELIDRIENKGHTAAIVPLLRYLIGNDGYEAMKAHYIKTEGRFRATKLAKVYEVILKNFDPKD